MNKYFVISFVGENNQKLGYYCIETSRFSYNNNTFQTKLVGFVIDKFSQTRFEYTPDGYKQAQELLGELKKCFKLKDLDIYNNFKVITGIHIDVMGIIEDAVEDKWISEI